MRCLSGKVVRVGVLPKNCKPYLGTNLSITSYNSNSNHDGSSGSMESSLCRILLEQINDITNGRVSVGILVTDDYSMLRSHCRSKMNGGKLKEGVVEPRFLADPSHRVKVMVKSVFELFSNTTKADEVKRIYALRLRKYTSYYMMKHRCDNFLSFFRNCKAPMEHLFDNKVFCDVSWCWAKEIDMGIHDIIMKSVGKR